MPLIRCNFYSDALELGTSMTVLLPKPSRSQIGVRGAAASGPPPVLYLLHGLTDDDTAWTRYTSIERYAAAKGLAVVMPQVHRSFYTDERHGLKFWTFLSEELPETVAAFFSVSTRREDTFVAGLSMGAYGAFKWALRQPERFAAAAGLSGALDVAWLYEQDDRPHMHELTRRVFGDRSPAGTEDDLLHLVGAAGAGLPPLLLRCGTEDHALPSNERFVAACARQGIAIDAKFGPGAHEWGYWDTEIRTVLDWLPLHLQR
ncbi:alpha/beta hydrolase family protein [Actinoplanes sp. N902-109]|uniref:alpha/beta hydrolase n=1 Tax=Actinoplanes sp. (strain N902-109) TaxID=649831 RepID=UPI0003294473|nr:alpha/beta hydrolase family protein [Actinoplanes sp. N902-109]AGL19691.1 esterase [Actinoplanes sp. N902-109]